MQGVGQAAAEGASSAAQSAKDTAAGAAEAAQQQAAGVVETVRQAAAAVSEKVGEVVQVSGGLGMIVFRLAARQLSCACKHERLPSCGIPLPPLLLSFLL